MNIRKIAPYISLAALAVSVGSYIYSSRTSTTESRPYEPQVKKMLERTELEPNSERYNEVSKLLNIVLEKASPQLRERIIRQFPEPIVGEGVTPNIGTEF